MRRKMHMRLENGDKYCHDCGKYLPIQEFMTGKSLNTYCCEHTNKRARERMKKTLAEKRKDPVFVEGEKKRIREWKHQNADRNRKQCRDYYARNKEKVKGSRQRYEKANPEVRRNILQRYRANLKATSDGTVTTKVLWWLYRSKKCFYCEKVTVPSERTVDHKIPISRGGEHSRDNIVMACQRCNFSKQDRTPEEFAEFQRLNKEK